MQTTSQKADNRTVEERWHIVRRAKGREVVWCFRDDVGGFWDFPENATPDEIQSYSHEHQAEAVAKKIGGEARRA